MFRVSNYFSGSCLIGDKFEANKNCSISKNVFSRELDAFQLKPVIFELRIQVISDECPVNDR